jgi:hypothetical protein
VDANFGATNSWLEGEEIGVTLGMVAKAAMGAQLRSAVEMVAEAAVESARPCATLSRG